NKNNLFVVITCYLFDDIKEFITEQGIQLPSKKSLLFDYLSFCRSINVSTINNVISIGSSLAYNQFYIQQEFYGLFMRKCPELKYFDMRLIKHQIFYFPEANTRLESLCELKCDTSIDSAYFYGLSRFCQHIQRLIIINIDTKPNHGIVKLIEVQKNLKYFEWKDDFDDDYLKEDPYDIFLHALEKKADSIDHLRIFFRIVFNIEHTLLQNILPKFHKLKTLLIDDYLLFNEEQLKNLVYHDLEILNIEFNKLNVISSIIENGGGRLKKILFRPYDTIDFEFNDNFNESSLNFIRKIYENCPLIEYLSIAFSPSKEHFNEFEKLLKICKNLKSLLLVILNIDMIETNEKILENGEKLLKILINSAPTNLKKIKFYDDFKFSLKNLEEFLEKWRGCPLSILTSDSIYESEDYKKLIDKYKNDGIIKDFRYESYTHLINYHISHNV
ncbi:7780_t:CDS:1, partial [Rhizophagus irregularis]